MSNGENFATYTTAERFTSLVYVDLLKYIQKRPRTWLKYGQEIWSASLLSKKPVTLKYMKTYQTHS